MVSRPVVQEIPRADAQTLNQALSRLGRNPRDVSALIDAGDAARELGDLDAAIGFYRRADELSTNSPKIKMGLARALVLSGDPVAAIPLFAEAERAGALPNAIASDRGLAYDLVGDNATAQQYYRAALGRSNDDELRMRLAVSQAISGDAEAAEQTLMPLLRKQDKAAWRTQAFALAIAGETKESVDLANRMLPGKLAKNVAPYLRYMPRLTKSQQAAAANLGKFPRASEIGRDDPRVAAYRPDRVAAVDSGLIPQGQPLGGGKGVAGKSSTAASKSKAQRAQAEEAKKQAEAAESRRKAALAAAEADRVAPPEPRPGIERSEAELPPVGAGRELPPASAPAQTAPAPTSAPAPTARLATASASANPGPPARTPSAASLIEKAPEPGLTQLSLSEIFADLGKPAAQIVPASGAVDIRKIIPAAPKPKVEPKPVEKPKKPAPPPHPSRNWVQIGVGRDKDAIAYDWRRYTRQAPELFKGRSAHITEMGQTNRILVGPFETSRDANEFVVDLGKAGIEGTLPWTSPAGQAVETLPTK